MCVGWEDFLKFKIKIERESSFFLCKIFPFLRVIIIRENIGELTKFGKYTFSWIELKFLF